MPDELRLVLAGESKHAAGTVLAVLQPECVDRARRRERVFAHRRSQYNPRSTRSSFVVHHGRATAGAVTTIATRTGPVLRLTGDVRLQENEDFKHSFVALVPPAPGRVDQGRTGVQPSELRRQGPTQPAVAD